MITTTKPEFVGAPDAAHARATRTMTGIPSLAVSKGGRLWTTQIEEKRKSFQASRSASLLLPRRTPFVPLKTNDGEQQMPKNHFISSALFDITDAARPGEKNNVAILCERKGLNELGMGGLLGPVMIYRDK